MRELEKNIIEMSKEFDEMKGCVSCELSIHKDTIDGFESFVKQNTNIKLGSWVIIECETCVSYNGKGYLHASIEKHSEIEKIKHASNFVKLLI